MLRTTPEERVVFEAAIARLAERWPAAAAATRAKGIETHTLSWAYAVKLYPDMDVAQLYNLCPDENLLANLAKTTRRWRARNNMGDLPTPMSRYLFSALYDLGLSADEMADILSAVPEGAYRLDIIKAIWRVHEEHPDGKGVLKREDLLDAWSDLSCIPTDVDVRRVARLEDIIPVHEALSRQNCGACAKNRACCIAGCAALPQDAFVPEGRPFCCTRLFHVCGEHAKLLLRRGEMQLRAGGTVEAVDLRGAEFLADGELVHFCGRDVRVAWAQRPLRRLKLLRFPRADVLWGDGGAHLCVNSLRFRHVERRTLHRSAGDFLDADGGRHLFTVDPYLQHNGLRIGWWAVIARMFMHDEPVPDGRGTLVGRYLAWGGRHQAEGRVRLHA